MAFQQGVAASTANMLAEEEEVQNEMDPDTFKMLMKATEDMVAKARLDQIARDHKSIGSILDNRVLHEIVEPKKRSKKSKMKLKNDLEAKEAALLAENAAAAEAMLEEKIAKEKREPNIGYLLRTEYAMEYAIWKEKSAPTTYSQKRRFQFPHLQHFKDHLNHDQQSQFRKRVGASLIELSNLYREECKALKADMDLNGVFHPEANAHRVHCIYLNKLYKGICSDNLEDPILKQMLAEEKSREAREAALVRHKEELLRSMEAADFENMSPAQKEKALADAAAKRKAEEEAAAEEEEAAKKQQQQLSPSRAGSPGGGGNSSSSPPSASGKITTAAGASNKVTFSSTSTKSGKLGSSPNVVGSAKLGGGSSSKMRTSASNNNNETVVASSVSFKNKQSKSVVTNDVINEEEEGEEEEDIGFGSFSAKTPKFGGGKSGKSAKVSASDSRKMTRSGESSKSQRRTSGGAVSSTATGSSKSAWGSDPPSVNTNNPSELAAAAAAAAAAVDAMPGNNNNNDGSGGGGGGDQGSLTSDAHQPSLTSSQQQQQSNSNPMVNSLTPQQKANDKLFKKIKANKLGGAEARSLLQDEASRLDGAESFAAKKTRDKNSILESEVSNWMLSSVQKQTIAKTSTGTAAAGASGGLSNTLKVSKDLSILVSNFNDSIRPTPSSPQKMLPFDAFQDMFRTFSEQQLASVNATAEGGGGDGGSLGHSSNSGSGGGGSLEGSKGSKSSVAGKAPAAAKKHLPQKHHQQHPSHGVTANDAKDTTISRNNNNSNNNNNDDDNNDSAVDKAAAAAAGGSASSIGGGSNASNTSSISAARQQQQLPHVETTNLVKTLMDMDAQFESYLKVAEHVVADRADGNLNGNAHTKMRAKLNAAIAKPRRTRKVTPLGRGAVNLTDSRGRVSKDAKKGFGNIFKSKEEEEDQDAAGAKGETQTAAAAAAADFAAASGNPLVSSDDLAGRLKQEENDSIGDDSSLHSGGSLSFTHSYSVSHVADLGGGGHRSKPGQLGEENPAAGSMMKSASAPNAAAGWAGTAGTGTGPGSDGGGSDGGGGGGGGGGSVAGKQSTAAAPSSASHRAPPGSRGRRHTHAKAGGAQSSRPQSEEHGVVEIPIPEPEKEQLSMQEKILAAWECLQVSAAQRFAFMRKYSTDEYSMEMARAVDIWAENAVYVTTLLEVSKLLTKIKSGTCVMPLKLSTVFHAIRRKMPPILATSAPSLIPPSLGYYDSRVARQTAPLSHNALMLCQRKIEHLFQVQPGVVPAAELDRNGKRNYSLSGTPECTILTTSIVSELLAELRKALKFAHVELDDIIPYGNKWCKEWAFTLSMAAGVSKHKGEFQEFQDSLANSQEGSIASSNG